MDLFANLVVGACPLFRRVVIQMFDKSVVDKAFLRTPVFGW